MKLLCEKEYTCIISCCALIGWLVDVSDSGSRFGTKVVFGLQNSKPSAAGRLSGDVTMFL